MHFSILLTALIGFTYVAAKPVESPPSTECEQECDDALAQCDDTAETSSGLYEFGEEIAWWVPVIFAVLRNRTDFVF